MRYIDWLRWLVLGALCLVLVVPFILADGVHFPINFFFPFITGKNFVFRILVELAFGGYLVLALREPKYRPRASLVMWTLCVFVLWGGVATFFSVDIAKSFWSNFERMDGYITLLHLFVLFVVAGAMFTAEQWWERFFKLSIAASAIQGLWALAQVLGFAVISTQSGPRVDTTFGNATYLAVYMLFNIFLTLFMLARERHSRMAQSLYGIALVLQMVALYYTETRGALLGVIGGLVIAALFVAWKGTAPEWKQLRKISLSALGVIAVLAVGFFAIRNTPIIQNSNTLSRVASISLTDRTTAARFQIWHMAYEGFKEKPLTGWGQENFNFVFNKYYAPSMYDQEQWFDRAHNQFLDWLVAGGAPAFLLYIALFLLAGWAILRAEKLSIPEQAAFLGLLAAYAFNNLFVFDNITSAFYFFILLAFVHGLFPKRPPGFMALSRPGSDEMVAIAAPILALAVFAGGWALNAPGIARANGLLDAITTARPVQTAQGVRAAARDPKENLAAFTQVLNAPLWPGTPLGRQETVEQLYQYTSSIASQVGVAPEVKQNLFTLTLQEGQALDLTRPNDARLKLFMSQFLGAYGQNKESLAVLTQALKESPQKQQIMFQLGALLIQTGDRAGAITILKKAWDEAPKYDTARIFYAISLYYVGNVAGGDAILVERFGTTAVDDGRLLLTYNDLKMYDRVQAIWQLRVAKNPKDPQMHAGLAAAYFAAGNKAATIAELQKAVGLDPSLATQVQALIKQINDGTLKPGQ